MKFPKSVISSLFGFLIFFCVVRANAQSVKDFSHITNVDSLFTQAQIALNLEGNTLKAWRLYKRIVELQPDNAVALASLSKIHLSRFRYSKGLNLIEKAVLADSKNTDYKKTAWGGLNSK